jgi:hypothetical protein
MGVVAAHLINPEKTIILWNKRSDGHLVFAQIHNNRGPLQEDHVVHIAYTSNHFQPVVGLNFASLVIPGIKIKNSNNSNMLPFIFYYFIPTASHLGPTHPPAHSGRIQRVRTISAGPLDGRQNLGCKVETRKRLEMAVGQHEIQNAVFFERGVIVVNSFQPYIAVCPHLPTQEREPTVDVPDNKTESPEGDYSAGL